MRQNRVLGILTALTIAVTSGSALPALSVSAGQLLGQTAFEDGVGLPWHVCESASGKMSFEVTDGAYRITIDNPGGASNGGEDRWDCQFRHRGLTLVSGCTYEVAYDITASNNCTYYTIYRISFKLLFYTADGKSGYKVPLQKRIQADNGQHSDNGCRRSHRNRCYRTGTRYVFCPIRTAALLHNGI